ncbi:MAG: histone deacetylase family protein [Hyphomonadaceae bacterium]|nr:histone deacetylase family protein [Hyphomonadaceae bacterium]
MLLITHPSMLEHGVPPGHPERPERLEAVLAALADMSLDRREAPWADRAAIERVHPAAFVTAMEGVFPQRGEGMVALDTGDTFLSDGSREAAWRAAGAVTAAVDAILAGDAQTAFCAVRPPGHHAEPAQAMGFCVFNSIAVGAMHALDAHGLARVCVVDFDVHHGNGSQAMAEREPRLLFASTHQSPLYPGTGRAADTGIAGNVVNAPLPPGAGSAHWRAAMETRILPAIDAFAPALVLVSAGFDAHKADPLAEMALEDADFAWAGAMLREAAQGSARGRVVASLEGGYDLRALGSASRAFVAALAA